MVKSGQHCNKKVHKLAIIGGSVDSAVGYTHLIASHMDHRWNLTAACFSRNDDDNAKTVEAWNLEKITTYHDWRKLLKDEQDRVEAVAILTPTPLHFEMVMECLRLGIPVICEKSLASTYDEAEQIYQAQKKYNGFLAVTHNYTGYPMLRELKSLVASGELGKITQIQVEMPQEGFSRLDSHDTKPIPQNWRLSDGVIPSVSLDLGTHLYHLMHFITGETPKSLISLQSTFGWFDNIVDDVSIISTFSSGMKSTMWYGKSALGHRNGLRIRIYGNKGSAEWFQMMPESLTLYDIYGDMRVLDRASPQSSEANQQRYQRFKSGHPAGFIEAFANLYVDIADKLEEYQQTKSYDKNWTYSSHQATKGLNFFEQAVLSNINRCWVDLTE